MSRAGAAVRDAIPEMSQARRAVRLGCERLQVVQVRGDEFERGRAQASAFPNELLGYETGLLDLGLAPTWMPPWLQRVAVAGLLHGGGGAYLAAHRGLLQRRWEGRHWDSLRGLAAGFGAPLGWLYGLHALELESANLGYSLGCTSLAFAPAHTHDGVPRLSYNHDFPPAFAPHLFIRESWPEAAAPDRPISGASGYRSLALTYAPLVGCIAGVNERGLGLSVNHAYATDLCRRRPALLVTLLAQECLTRCADVAEALELIAQTPVTNGSIMTLVDRSGDRAAVELSARACRVRRASAGRILASFNKYQEPSMAAREVPVGAMTTGLAAGIDVHACNLTRQRRFDELTCEAHKYADGDIQRLMSDHDGHAGDRNTLCRHGDPLGGETIASVIIEPASGALQVMFDFPCRGAYVRHTLPVAPARGDGELCGYPKAS